MNRDLTQMTESEFDLVWKSRGEIAKLAGGIYNGNAPNSRRFAKELTFVREPYFRDVVTACAFSSSVAEFEQDKTTLQRVVMNRAWPKPSMKVPVSPRRASQLIRGQASLG